MVACRCLSVSQGFRSLRPAKSRPSLFFWQQQEYGEYGDWSISVPISQFLGADPIRSLPQQESSKHNRRRRYACSSKSPRVSVESGPQRLDAQAH
jgi:hypothetical protein